MTQKTNPPVQVNRRNDFAGLLMLSRIDCSSCSVSRRNGKLVDAVLNVPKRIIYFITTLNRGGAERNMVQYCLMMDRSKFKIEVWCLYESDSEFLHQLRDSGIIVRILGAPSGFKARFVLKIARLLANEPADLVHVFLPTVAYYAVVAKAVFRMKTPLVFSSGGTQMTLPGQQAICRYGVGRYCYPIICNSNSVREWWIGIGVKPELLRVISNGHTLEKYDVVVDPNTIRQELGLYENDVLILTVGRLIASKRICDLLQAIASLTESGRFPGRICLAIAGDGPVRESLTELTASLGLEAQVKFLGVRSDVLALMKSADLFAFPSESEGLPNAVIEASLAGLPIVASNIGPVQEVVTDNESASLVDVRSPDQLAAAISELISNPQLAEQRAEVAKRKSQTRFNLDSTLAHLETAYADAIDGYR